MNTLQLLSIIMSIFGHSLLSSTNTTLSGYALAILAFIIGIILAIIGGYH